MASKPWYLSKSIWLSLVGGIASALAAAFPQANAVSQFIAANLPVIGMIWGVLGLVVRLVTKDKISLVE